MSLFHKPRILPARGQFVRGMLVVLMCAVMTLVAPAHSFLYAAASGERQRIFENAAAEFGVPDQLLLAISYNQTRWENHDGEPSVVGGYGLMHLTSMPQVEDGRGDPARPLPVRTSDTKQGTLEAAASAARTSKEAAMRDDAENVRAGAALLAQYAKDSNGGQTPGPLQDWYGAVAKIGAPADAAAAEEFADAVFATVRKGVSATTTDGQTLSIAPTQVDPNKTKLDGLGLRPRPAQPKSDTECPPTVTCKFVPARFAQNNPSNPADYGNMDTSNRPHNTKIKYIVIHDTEGSYQSAISWFQDPISYVAAHYVIRSSDGEITQMVKTKDIGWHAGNWYMNMHSIGVEHEGFAAEGGSWYTDTMYRSSAKLVRYLAEKYDIPLDRQHIVGHEQYHGLTPARAKKMHSDPGPYWDWDYYMDLLHGREGRAATESRAAQRQVFKAEGFWSRVVTIAPEFAKNQPPVTECKDGVCRDLPRQGSNFIYLRTQPRIDAPLLSDAGLHPDGSPGTTEISDWSAKAVQGQKFAVAERQGDWIAIWFGGQKGWFHNPSSWRNQVAMPSWSLTVSPKNGKDSIPVYGRPVPEEAAFKNGVPVITPVPLQYTIPAGQSYPAYEGWAPNDYYHVATFDRSGPGDGTTIIGNERYIPIEYNHRQAFVKASDVDLRW